MANGLSEQERTIKELFLHTCWEYLRDNFHKFNETNKIKIALTLAQKDLPQEIKGNYNVTQMPKAEVSGNPINIEVGSNADSP